MKCCSISCSLMLAHPYPAKVWFEYCRSCARVSLSWLNWPHTARLRVRSKKKTSQTMNNNNAERWCLTHFCITSSSCIHTRRQRTLAISLSFAHLLSNRSHHTERNFKKKKKMHCTLSLFSRTMTPNTKWKKKIDSDSGEDEDETHANSHTNSWNYKIIDDKMLHVGVNGTSINVSSIFEMRCIIFFYFCFLLRLLLLLLLFYCLPFILILQKLLAKWLKGNI